MFGKQNKKGIFVVQDVKDILGVKNNEKTITIFNCRNVYD